MSSDDRKLKGIRTTTNHEASKETPEEKHRTERRKKGPQTQRRGCIGAIKKETATNTKERVYRDHQERNGYKHKGEGVSGPPRNGHIR